MLIRILIIMLVCVPVAYAASPASKIAWQMRVMAEEAVKQTQIMACTAVHIHESSSARTFFEFTTNSDSEKCIKLIHSIMEKIDA